MSLNLMTAGVDFISWIKHIDPLPLIDAKRVTLKLCLIAMYGKPIMAWNLIV